MEEGTQAHTQESCLVAIIPLQLRQIAYRRGERVRGGGGESEERAAVWILDPDPEFFARWIAKLRLVCDVVM